MKKTKNVIPLGGHRGLGCTDHDFYQFRDIVGLPVENTAASIAAAFDAGVDYIETDAVMTQDGILATLHNVVPKDHFFGTDIPLEMLNAMPLASIRKYRTGRHQNGELALLSDVLAITAGKDPYTLPWAINIEIKGVQGSGQPYEGNDYLQNLADTVKRSPLAANRILWSSFSLANIIAMTAHFPESQYGMLFGEKPDARAIYADRQDDPLYQYLPFNPSTIRFVADSWPANIPAKLGYLHPEITTIGPAELNAAQGFGINCWALFEKYDAGRAELYRQTQAMAAQNDIPFTIITDYLPELQAL